MRHRAGMTCPKCTGPMKAGLDNQLVCEPCREYVLLFAVTLRFTPPFGTVLEELGSARRDQSNR